jgi:cytochrome c556
MAFVTRVALGLALSLAVALMPGLIPTSNAGLENNLSAASQTKRIVAAREPGMASTSEAVIAYRRRTMAAISAHYRALELTISQQAPFADQALIHADALAALALQLQAIFAADSTQLDKDGYGAKPTIWSEPEAFAAMVDTFDQDLHTLTVQLQRKRPRAEQAATLNKVRQSCLNCHRQFRVRQT